MPASWSFNKEDLSDVEVEITQRDQFNNEYVGLNDALVREVVQNSLDALSGDKPVKVSFSIQNLAENKDDAVRLLQNNIKPLIPHLEACKIPKPNVGAIRVLTIEDYNTKGLTGSIDQRNRGENFTNFWRAVGKSKKEGRQGGRWGLGKLVFSSSSQIRTFFGVTLRDGDSQPSAMGQISLEHHDIDGTSYKPHGFWHDGRTKERIQKPTSNVNDLDFLKTISSRSVREKNGLSIIIPYLNDNVNENDIVGSVLKNFFFPIMANRLTVEVGKSDNVVINASTFSQTVKDFNLKRDQFPLSFFTEVCQSLEEKHTLHVSKPLTSNGFSVENLSTEQINELKRTFREGNLVHIKIPVILTHKTDGKKYGSYHLFIRQSENEVSCNFFARGPILLTAESIKVSSRVHSGIIAEYDDPVSEFLGDAETPSHAKLDYKADKLVSRWGKQSSSIVSAIRKSLVVLFRIISEQEQITDSDVLSRFFSLNEGRNRKKGKKQKQFPPEERNVDESKNSRPTSPVGFVIARNPEGFLLVSTKDAERWDWSKTKKIRISIAYAMVSGNPFRSYNRHDFDLYDSEST